MRIDTEWVKAEKQSPGRVRDAPLGKGDAYMYVVKYLTNATGYELSRGITIWHASELTGYFYAGIDIVLEELVKQGRAICVRYPDSSDAYYKAAGHSERAA